jgi:transmembrane sensor
MSDNKKDSVNQWIKGTLAGEDLRNFEQTEEFKKLQKMFAQLDTLKAPEYNVEHGFAELIQKVQEKEHTVPQSKVVNMISWLKPAMRIAAAVVIAVGGYFLLAPKEKPTEIKTLASQRTEVTLPDLSTVALNASSRISFVKGDWKKNRKVVLHGEAFFKVAKGSRFDVQTTSGTVSVLGTQFNIVNRRGYFEVTCYEGLVSVKSGGNTIKLSANNVFRLLNGQAVQNQIAPSLVPDWMHNESSFRSIPFAQVISELERQFGVSVTIEKVDTSKLFTGKFSNTDLNLALKSITSPLNLTYQVNGNSIVLRSGE